MPLRGPGLLPLLFLLCSGVHADEAIDRRGRRHFGEFANRQFAVKSTGDKIAIADLQSVAFSRRPIPPATVTPSFRLHLRTGEQISGQLLRGDADSLEFQASFGAKHSFKRSMVLGIEQPDGFRRVLHDSFATDLSAWSTVGSPSIDRQGAAVGERGLRLDRPGQSAQREWKPAFDSGRINVHFKDESNAPSLGWHLAVRLEGKQPTWLDCFHATSAEYASPQPWRRRQALLRRPGWHLLQVDFAGARCRVYLDDFLIGEYTGASPLHASGVRLQTTEGKPAAWRFDFVEAAQRGAPVRFETNADADVLLLPGGAEYLGTLERADEQGIVFKAHRGTRSYPWSQVQGFAFAYANRKQAKPLVEVSYRSGPGVAPDRIHGSAIEGSEGGIRLTHPLWGEVRLDRDRLDRLVWHDRK